MSLKEQIAETVRNDYFDRMTIDDSLKIASQILDLIAKKAKEQGWGKTVLTCADGKDVNKPCKLECNISPRNTCCIHCPEFGSCDGVCELLDEPEFRPLTEEEFKRD